MEKELLIDLKNIKNKYDLKNVLNKAIKNGYDMIFLDDRYCPNINTDNYDIEVDNSNIIRIFAPNPRPYIRHYNNFYKSFIFTKATSIGFNTKTKEEIYNIRYNIIMY